MSKKLLVSLAAIALLTACKKESPTCSLDESIRKFRKSQPCGDAQVDKYRFQQQVVYVFDPGTCGNDMAAGVMDADCNTLGSLGGFSGETRINGEDFSNAEFLATVWPE